MHVLLVHQVFVRPEDPGGTRHFELAARLARNGHRVTILASSQSYQTGRRLTVVRRETLSPGVEVRRCWVAGSFTRTFVSRTVGFLSFILSSFVEGMRVQKVDVVWGTSPPLLQVASAWALARAKRVPFAFEVRDLWPAFAIQVGVLRNPLLVALSRWLERFLYRHADRIIINSPGFAEHLEHTGADRDRVTLVPNGVDTRMFDPRADGTPWRVQHGLRQECIAMYAGAHGLSNDLGVVLDAAERLKTKPKIVFVLVGDGKEKPRLMAEAQSRGLANVRFLPSQAKSQMPAALAAANCGIAILMPLPLYATTFPNKVFDYMAAGKPVVLAIDGVIRRVVEQANAGVFVPPGDATRLAETIAWIADHPREAREMGSRGRACVEAGYDRELAAELLERLLEDMVAHCGRRAAPRAAGTRGRP
jgi:glycosyltransferase involved in cell wall biosynthesis